MELSPALNDFFEIRLANQDFQGDLITRRPLDQSGDLFYHLTESTFTTHSTMNVLFICSMNRWRSRTAEKVFANRNSLSIRSRGTSDKARATVRSFDLKWADIVFAMERKHARHLLAKFPAEMSYSETHVLDIRDDYRFMAPELVDELEAAVNPLLSPTIE